MTLQINKCKNNQNESHQKTDFSEDWVQWVAGGGEDNSSTGIVPIKTHGSPDFTFSTLVLMLCW